jgi:nucleoside-diphosphate-sugar epimerase
LNRSGKTVLLTGGSGVVGQAALEKLTDCEVICLVHRAEIDRPNVRLLKGDITQPHLGLSNEQFSELARQVDYVVHSAASTSFGETKLKTYRINVEGTRHVLELADRANVPFCHISTAFAHLQSFDPSHLSNPYEASKLEAEDAVTKSGVPNVILRPSVVIGDSHDGSMSRFQGFHFLFEQMLRGLLPLWVPCKPTAYMDFIPQDLVAEVIALMVREDKMRGDYWVTAGPRALTAEQAVELWQTHIPRLTGKQIKPPRYVDPDVIDRLIKPVFLPQLPPRMQSMVNQALGLLSFSISEPLPTSMPELEAKYGIMHLPDSELSIVRTTEFWARTRGLDQAV